MPTIKQKRAIQKMVENGGNASKAMESVGYSKNTAKTPQKLTESKGWQELVEQHLSDKDLTREHRKVLLQDKDLGNKLKAVDMGYKLKDKYKEKEGNTINIPILVQFLDGTKSNTNS